MNDNVNNAAEKLAAMGYDFNSIMRYVITVINMLSNQDDRIMLLDYIIITLDNEMLKQKKAAGYIVDTTDDI